MLVLFHSVVVSAKLEEHVCLNVDDSCTLVVTTEDELVEFQVYISKIVEDPWLGMTLNGTQAFCMALKCQRPWNVVAKESCFLQDPSNFTDLGSVFWIEPILNKEALIRQRQHTNDIHLVLLIAIVVFAVLVLVKTRQNNLVESTSEPKTENESSLLPSEDILEDLNHPDWDRLFETIYKS